MVPGAVLQRHGEDVHDAVVERLAAGVRIVLLRIARAGADHVVRVVARVDDDFLDLLEVVDFLPHAEGQVDQRLRLVLGGVLLRVGFQNLAARLARLGQPDLIDASGPSSIQAITLSSPS